MTVKAFLRLNEVWLCLGLIAGGSAWAASLSPAQADRNVNRARELYWEARRENDETRRLRLYEAGRDLAQAARESAPRNPGAILWWVANEGRIAEAHRNLSSLAAIGRIRAALLELRELDAGYGYAAADRGLGDLYHRAPGLISFGSDRKAEEHLRQAVKRAPEYPGNSLELAEFLLDTGRSAEARQLAESVLRKGVYRNAIFGEFTAERPDWARSLSRILSATTKEKGG